MTLLSALLARLRRRVETVVADSERTPAGEALLERMRAVAGPDEAAAVAATALAEAPEDLRNLVDIGIVARDRGALDAAERVFLHILERDPAYAFAQYEMAFTRNLEGRPVEALQWLDELKRHRPVDARADLFAARLLYRLGRRGEGDARLADVPPGLLTPEQIGPLQDFGAWLERNPPAACLEAARALDAGFADTPTVAARIADALSAGRGFSLIRLGDGEGAFIPPAAEAEAYPRLRAHNREDRARVWFAGELDLERSGFLDAAASLKAAVAAADIVGLPYFTWVEHELRTASVTGLTTLCDLVRSVSEWRRPEQLLCRQTIHLDLFQTGPLAALLHEQTRVGLISCHPQLPRRLQAAFCIDDVEFHKLPGEKLFRDRIGPEAAGGVHFPDVFEATMAALDRPLEGRLFLVAGGILGKLYCDRIRRSGGVAVDIGSLADIWVGAATRPGYAALPPL